MAEPKAAAGILSMYPGPISLIGNRFAELSLRELRLGKTELPGGATVAHLAFYLAEYLGADPIIFVGQDLGFSDGLCYAPGTSYDDVWRPETSRFCTVEMKQWEQIVREKYILRRIPDYLGRPMYTEERLFTYLQQFERDFAPCKSLVIDATEGGAAKRSAKPMPLAEVIERFCTAPLPQFAGDYPPAMGSRRRLPGTDREAAGANPGKSSRSAGERFPCSKRSAITSMTSAASTALSARSTGCGRK